MRGTALSFVDTSEIDLFQQVENDLAQSESNETIASQESTNITQNSVFKTFKFKMNEIEGFRYRARDVLRSITNILVKETRIKEIKSEMLNSEKLKSYFDENPREAQILRHDKEVNVTKLQEHLKHVPDYISKKLSDFFLLFAYKRKIF
jgi:ATP-dependent RNA helicase DDX56/DBP9